MHRRISRRTVLWVTAVCVVAIVVATYLSVKDTKQHAGTKKVPKPATSQAVKRSASSHPHFNVVGHCSRGRGSLFAAGSGFTPNGRYVTMAWYPSGEPYTRIANPGHASPQGTTPNWRWPCEKIDPKGTYEVRVVDLETATISNLESFEVSP
jgi:hypothetical protein